MNVCTFVGRLGRDSEKKELGDNTVLNFSLASDVGYGDKKSTLWVNCAVWGKRADTVMEYLHKGDKITVAGSGKLQEYTRSKDNSKGYSLQLRVSDFTLPPKTDKTDADF